MTCERHPEVDQPSIAAVTCNSALDMGRLPTYRSAHLTRYHPYPRPSNRVTEVWDEEVFREKFEGSGGDVVATETARDMVESIPFACHPDGDAAALHCALEQSTLDIHGWSRANFVTLVIDLALALSRRFGQPRKSRDG